MDLQILASWLLERALEHDKPLLLFQLACEKLYRDKIVRLGVTRLEKLVATARHQAQQETYRRLTPLLTPERRALLDWLLIVDETAGRTPLSWLRQRAISHSASAILAGLEKLDFLRRQRVEGWDLSVLTPNRRKLLAQLGRKSSSQALQRASVDRRYPILLVFLHQCLVDITDEIIEMYDQCLSEAYAQARHDLERFRRDMARLTDEKVRLFRDLGRAVLNPQIEDVQLRQFIYLRISPGALQRAVEESDQLIRPPDDSYFDFLEKRYGYFRQFAPVFLNAFIFRSNAPFDSLLEAVELLRRLNCERRRSIPDGAPVSFIPSSWRPYVIDREGRINRRSYESCVLWELRNALRAGNVWLEKSRRYANPETYLIPQDHWPKLRTEVCRQIQAPSEGIIRLRQHEVELAELLTQVDTLLSQDGKVRMENGHLIVSPLQADGRPESLRHLEQLIEKRLPPVELSELLIEVDRWTGFSQCFEHAAGSEPRTPHLQRHLYAAILAQGCNLGLTRMAQSADLSYDRLAWCTNWYLREETLKAAVGTLVNFQYHQPLSQYWGGGTLSSSDGQRLPTSGKIRNATALPRYFGYGKGVTFYTWTSDQFSQYGTKVIPSTVRDATYVLDEILDNETELPIVEHTTDTSGYTELIFALFDLLGLQFAPRIRDIGDQRLYRLDRTQIYPHLESRLHGTIQRDLILGRWEDLLRVAGSLKLGWVTASLLINKLQSYPRQNALTRALQEYGRLIKTIFILRYLESEAYRRRINLQLNKGEALHALRRFLFFANAGHIQRKQEEEQANQASCLNLVTNAVVVWNTVYMKAAIDQLQTQGYPVRDEDLVHLSPARYEHINPYGKYRFEVDQVWNSLRPLRKI
jgi:TnpA family transposase